MRSMYRPGRRLSGRGEHGTDPRRRHLAYSGGTDRRPSHVRHAPAWPILALVLLLATAHAHGEDGVGEPGAALLQPFKQHLQRALQDSLAEGTVNAINACRVQAPAVAARLATGGIRLGRTSDRLRNPDNAAPEWVLPILARYAREANDRMPRTVALTYDRTGYVEPIVVQPLCLSCHGKQLEPAVAARLAALYPTDRAVGYAAGDLRGVFWLEAPTRRSQPPSGIR